MNHHSEQPVARTVCLTELKLGEVATIEETALDGEDAAYLRALGIRRHRRVRLCRCTGSCIVEVGSGAGPWCRVALARKLAEGVRVGV